MRKWVATALPALHALDAVVDRLKLGDHSGAQVVTPQVEIKITV